MIKANIEELNLTYERLIEYGPVENPPTGPGPTVEKEGGEIPTYRRRMGGSNFDGSTVGGTGGVGGNQYLMRTESTHSDEKKGGRGNSNRGVTPVHNEWKTTIRIYVRPKLLLNYFNNIIKCWEPLLESLKLSVLYEEVG